MTRVRRRDDDGHPARRGLEGASWHERRDEDEDTTAITV